VPAGGQRRSMRCRARLLGRMVAGVDVNARDLWQRIHAWPRRLRWPLKGGLLAVTVLLTLFPKVWLVPVWIERLQHLNEVVDPTYPGLAGLEAQVAARVGEKPALADVVRPVEEAVYQRIPYAYDWDTWGVMDYLPTVAEVFAMGREDCDGRAVVAASLLRRMGYSGWLVSDLTHTWVVARDDAAAQPVELELMAPGKGQKTLAGRESGAGTRLNLGFGAVRNLARGLSFGISVFPVGRELLILSALCVVTLQPWSSIRRRAAGCLLLALALWLLRSAGAPSGMLGNQPALVWVGAGAGLAGWLLLALKARSLPTPAVASQDGARMFQR
jgi:hypothetical protein